MRNRTRQWPLYPWGNIVAAVPSICVVALCAAVFWSILRGWL